MSSSRKMQSGRSSSASSQYYAYSAYSPASTRPASNDSAYMMSPNLEPNGITPANEFELFLDQTVPKAWLLENMKKFEANKSILQSWKEYIFNINGQLQNFQAFRYENLPNGLFRQQTQPEIDLLQKKVTAETTIRQQLEALLKTLEDIVYNLNQFGQLLVGSVMDQWKLKQKSWQWGHPTDNSFELLADRWQTLSKQLDYAKLRVEEMIPDATDHLQVACENLRLQIEDMLIQYLIKSFVVSKQPPTLVKNSVSTGVRVLAAQRHTLLETSAPKITCELVLMEEAMQLAAQNQSYSKIKAYGTLSLDKTTLSFTDAGDTLLGIDPKIRITNMVNRKKDKSTDRLLTIKQKYCLLYSCTLTFAGRQLQLSTLSLPFVVSVHGTQDSQILGSSFWDLGFTNYVEWPLREVESVKWPRFAEALGYLFTGYVELTRRHLDQTNLNCIAQQLFGRRMSQNELNNADVTYEMVYGVPKTSPNGKKANSFSFWEWFFAIMEMLKHKSGRQNLKELYEPTIPLDGRNSDTHYLEGFICKQEAEERLRRQIHPCMILRFSNRTLQSIVVVYKRPEKTIVEHLAPFTMAEDLKRFSLPYLLERVTELRDVPYIFPKIPKAQLCETGIEVDWPNYVSSDYVKWHLSVKSDSEANKPPVIEPLFDWDVEDLEEYLKNQQSPDTTQLHNFVFNVDSPAAFSPDQIGIDQPMEN